MGTVTPKNRTLEICALLHGLSTEHPGWATPLRFAAFYIATKYRIPKSDRLWEGATRKIRRKPKKKEKANG